jgi:hypothetical protein
LIDIMSATTTGTVLGAIGLVLSVLASIAVLLIALRVVPGTCPSELGSTAPVGSGLGNGQRAADGSTSGTNILWSNMPSGTSIKLGYNQPTAAASAVPYSLVLDAQCAAGYDTCEINPIAQATQIRPLRKTSAAGTSYAVYWSPSTYELSADYTTNN